MPENTPAYIAMEEQGVAPWLWLKQWCKLTDKNGSLRIPENGTFNLRILEQLRMALYESQPLPRPAQFEVLAVWELVARQQQQMKFERRIRRVEKALAEARWDGEQKKWRSVTLQDVKLLPATTQEDETGGKKATRKTNKSSPESKEAKRSSIVEEESDAEDLVTQILRDRPQLYVVHEGGPRTSADPTAPAQVTGTVSPVQVNANQTQGVMQGSPNVLTTPGVQAQMQRPPTQRIYPDVPILETTLKLVVPTEEVLPRPMLNQT
ncbi:hypothetical protein NDU88_001560 [Pleurodeles waltl]|uniref:Uncharacterized protein n=1 Tax=Pleurodeles waltl TaxID=8319 RepID=A0AAV7V840_PLEWA|nr:hypothetical protein NDU88_001560 [Pleurodeles waltl]